MNESWHRLLREGLSSGFPSDELMTHMDDILAWFSHLGETDGTLEKELVAEYGDLDQVRRKVVEVLDRLLFVTPTSDKTLFGRAALRSPEVLKRRYSRLMRVFHPDRGYHDSGWLTARSEIINTRYMALLEKGFNGDMAFSNGDQREVSISAAVTAKSSAPKVKSEAELAFLSALRRHLPESPQKLQRMVLGGLVTVSVVILAGVYQGNRTFDVPVQVVDAGNQVSGIGDQGLGNREEKIGNGEQETVAVVARLETTHLTTDRGARREAERLAVVEAAKKEMDLKAAEEAARLEAERLAVAEEAKRVEMARLEAERVAMAEAARIEVEKVAAAEEAARIEAARVEAERVATMEAAKIEVERLAAAEEAVRVEAERVAAAGTAKIEAERVVADEAAKVEAARLEAERLAVAEEAKRVEVARLEAERVATAEAARIEAARVEAERVATMQAAKIEVERLAAAEEAVRVESERVVAMEVARKEAGRVAAAEEAKKEAERIAAATEVARVEVERVAATEVARLEAVRIAAAAAAKAEADRIAAEEEAVRVAAAKLEAERVEQERIATEQAAVRLREEEFRYHVMTMLEGMRKAYDAGDAGTYAAFFAQNGSDSDMRGRDEIERRYDEFFSGTESRSWHAEIHDMSFASSGTSNIAGVLQIQLQQGRRKQFNRSYNFSMDVETVEDGMQITSFDYEEK